MFKKDNSGQALIIIVLIIALVLTVIAASSYQLTVQTEGSKLQEESVRALAAADAGIEVGLKIANTERAPQSYSYNDPLVNISLPGIDPTKSQILVTTTSQTSFSSPLVLKDDQYTFYTNDFPTFTNPVSFGGLLRIHFGSEGSGDCNAPRSRPALEMTIIYGSNNDMQRRIIEPCTTGQTVSSSSSYPVSLVPTTFESITYQYQIANINMLGEFPDAKMIIIRPLFANTRLFFSAQSSSFPSQGKRIEARAFSISGPSKIVTIFQSLPQIPADFFVTSF